MRNTKAFDSTIERGNIEGEESKVKRLSHTDIQHLFIDLQLSNRELAKRLEDKHGLKVSGAYVGMLLRKTALGARPFGALVLKAIAQELGVQIEQLRPEEHEGDTP